MDFDIAPQPLISAVEAFATASGVQVLYDRPPDARPRSPGVRGRLTPQSALEKLLRGTGLAARFTDPRDALLAPPGGEAASFPASGAPPTGLPTLALPPLRVRGDLVLGIKAPDGGGAPLYAQMLQSGLQQALSSDPRTSRGSYDAALELRVGPTGGVQQVRIARSSGELQRDADILAVVSQLVLDEAPPADLPQPIQVTVRSRRPS